MRYSQRRESQHGRCWSSSPNQVQLGKETSLTCAR
nr:MAG TPA_asm: hypothetical protein [Caudoviricetes sp.]